MDKLGINVDPFIPPAPGAATPTPGASLPPVATTTTPATPVGVVSNAQVYSVIGWSLADMMGHSAAGRQAKGTDIVKSKTWQNSNLPEHFKDFKDDKRDYNGIANSYRDMAYAASDAFANSHWLSGLGAVGLGTAAVAVGSVPVGIIAAVLAAGAATSLGFKVARTAKDMAVTKEVDVNGSTSTVVAFTPQEAIANNFGAEIQALKIGGKVATYGAGAVAAASLMVGAIATVGVVPGIIGTLAVAGFGGLTYAGVQAAKGFGNFAAAVQAQPTSSSGPTLP